MPKCPDCKKTFPGGERAGHCAACCETFIGLAAFEAHRVGEHGTPDRRCELKPETYTNSKGQTAHGHWRDDNGYLHIGQRGYWADESKHGTDLSAENAASGTGGHTADSEPAKTENEGNR